MPRLAPLAVPALLLMLVACDADSPPQLHDVTVTGVLDARITYFYGEPRSFVLEGRELTLGAVDPDAPPDPLGVFAALRVDGAPYLREHAEAPDPVPVQVQRIPLTTDLQLRTVTATRAVLYYDGASWFTLGQDDPARLDVRVTPRPRGQRLRGLGQLTVSEADALADHLESLGEPLVGIVLDAGDTPTRSVDGVAEYRSTAIHVERGIGVDVTAFRPAPRTVQWEVVARGSQAVGLERESYRLLRDEADLRTVWNQAHGASLDVPPVPRVDFARETVLAVFLGTRPTGGYGLDVRGVTIEGGDLFVDLVVTEPAPGAVVTQALTSPWVLVRVLRGGIDAAWFRDPGDGRLYAVARRTD
jgi:hypothetical protein